MFCVFRGYSVRGLRFADYAAAAVLHKE
jgi:hypothetical protein